jgi:hypothetical protein
MLLLTGLLVTGGLAGCGGYGPKATVKQDKDRPVPASKSATGEK